MADQNDKVEFKDFFRFTTKDGKMKSGTVVYSFTWAALYIVIYFAVFYFTMGILERFTAPMSIFLSDLIGAVVPAVIGTLICWIPIHLISNKKPAFLGFVWDAVFTLLFFIAMALMLRKDHDAFLIFLRLFMALVPLPLLFGGGLAWFELKKSEMIEGTSEDYD